MVNATIWNECTIKILTKAPVENHRGFGLALFELVEECNHLIIIRIEVIVFSGLKPKVLIVFARFEFVSAVKMFLPVRQFNCKVFTAIQNRVTEISSLGGLNGLDQMHDIECDDHDAIQKGKHGRRRQKEGEEEQDHKRDCDERGCSLIQIVPAESHEKFLLKNVY